MLGGGRRGGGRGLASRGGTLVPEGGRHATIPSRAGGEAAVRAFSVVCRAGGDRDLARATARGCGGARETPRRLARAPSTISRELRRNAATRSGALAYRATTAQGHADRSPRRPKSAKLAINEPLRHSVQDRVAGLIIAPNGAAVHGPVVPWKGRRHGRRQDRRGARAWSPKQIARRLRLDF